MLVNLPFAMCREVAQAHPKTSVLVVMQMNETVKWNRSTIAKELGKDTGAIVLSKIFVPHFKIIVLVVNQIMTLARLKLKVFVQLCITESGKASKQTGTDSVVKKSISA